MRLCLAVCLLAAPTAAQDLMTPTEFEAWSTGRTLDYFIDGQYWGSEQHLNGRQTRDADAEGPCRQGIWYPQGDAVCFVYVGIAGDHCWRFWRRDGTVMAEILGAPDAPQAEVRLSSEPLACPGPEVGV